MSRKTARVVGSYQARTHFSELIEQVEAGEEITITRHGTPVARLVPIQREASREVRERAIREWRDAARDITLGEMDLKDLIEEGRA